MEYRGISRAKYHRVLDEIVIDSQELLDFYLQFPQEVTYLGMSLN